MYYHMPEESDKTLSFLMSHEQVLQDIPTAGTGTLSGQLET